MVNVIFNTIMIIVIIENKRCVFLNRGSGLFWYVFVLHIFKVHTLVFRAGWRERLEMKRNI